RDKVETYASRFKKLANRVDARGIPDAFKVRMFLNGLNKE
ncbi:1510_t:CDS:1, partial [Funneliformis geosporum]